MKRRAVMLFVITSALVLAGYIVSIFILCNPIETKEIYCNDIALLADFYEKNIRGHLFAGFLALGGFLLSLKTFIVVNMKENVYDNKKYQENWKKQKKLDENMKLYEPLKELSDLLFYAILASIVSAIMQMSLGLYSHWFASVVCIWSAIYAASLLISSLVLIKQNLDIWFSYLEE